MPESESFVARPRVFCASLADWIDDEVPIGWLADLLRLIYETQNLDWQLLTKRPQNWESRCFKVWEECHGFEQETRLGDWLFEWLTQNSPPANVWIGTTAEDQTRANERIPALLNIPAKVRFLSCEPLLGPVRFPSGDCPCGKPLCYDPARDGSPRGIHWVIAGGESGANARPMNPEWARSLRDQCAAAKVPFLFKQWGEWLPDTQNPKVDHPKSSDRQGIKVGKKAAGRLLDGIEHNGFPGVRE